MKIRDPRTIYGGFDYLPDYYPVLIHKLGYKAYGVFLNGKLISMSLHGIIDGGQTLIPRAGRINPEYEKMHLTKRFQEQLVKKLDSSVTRNAFSFSNAVDTVRNYVNASKKTTVLFRKVLYIYRTKQEHMMEHIQNATVPKSVKVYDKEGLHKLLHSQNKCHYIFPENRVFVDHVPYRLMTSNIPFILSHRCIMLGSNLDMENDPDKWLVTFGNYIVCPAGILYNIDLYGQNMNELYGHLLVHLDRLRIMTNTDVQVEIICDQKVEEAVCNKLMKGLGFERIEFFRSYFTAAEEPIDSGYSTKSNVSNSRKSKL